jgi:hypothetical protein
LTLRLLVASICAGIQRQEGFLPGTRAWRNHNPGNLWDGSYPGKVGRIWPQYPLDDAGFVIFPDYATGFSEMEHQVQLKVERGDTLRVLVNQWDSGDPQRNRDTYLADLVEWTGFPADTPLVALVG